MEQIDPYIKFLFRRGYQYVYRNHVRMDDVILSCKILNSSCTDIFNNSQDESFRKKLMNILDISKPTSFEETVGCLLVAKANKNFIVPRSMRINN